MKKGVVYRLSCKICLEADRQSVYLGETYRTSYDRCLEHQNLIRNKSVESPLYEHSQTDHPDREPSFKMEIVGVYRRPLQRQTKEGQVIADYKGGTLLNKKGEWGQNLPPKFEIVTEGYTNGAKSSNPDSRQTGKKIRLTDNQRVDSDVSEPGLSTQSLPSKQHQDNVIRANNDMSGSMVNLSCHENQDRTENKNLISSYFSKISGSNTQHKNKFNIQNAIRQFNSGATEIKSEQLINEGQMGGQVGRNIVVQSINRSQKLSQPSILQSFRSFHLIKSQNPDEDPVSVVAVEVSVANQRELVHQQAEAERSRETEGENQKFQKS